MASIVLGFGFGLGSKLATYYVEIRLYRVVLSRSANDHLVQYVHRTINQGARIWETTIGFGL